MSVLKFSLKEEYKLTPNIYGPELSFDVRQLESYFFPNFMAVGYERLIVHFRAMPLNRNEYNVDHLICDLAGSKVISRNMSTVLNFGPNNDPTKGPGWRSCRLNDSLLFTGPSNKVQLVADFGRGESMDIPIENPLQDRRDDWRYEVDYHQNSLQTSIGEDPLISIPIKSNGKTDRIGILSVDVGSLRTEWTMSFRSEYENLMSRVSGIQIKEQDQVGRKPNPLIKTQASKLFGDAVSSVDGLTITHSMLRNGNLYIFTRGITEGTYRTGGHKFSAIAHIDENGNILSFPFFLDHRTHSDGKKRGHFARFTSSKKYCILKSIYKPADDWKGKQRLFDMDSHDLIELKLPRGYSNYQLIDHNGLDFWFQKPVKSGVETEIEIIRCEVI